MGAVLLNCDCHGFDYIVAVVMGVAGLSYTEAIDVMDTVNFGRLDWAWFDGGCCLRNARPFSTFTKVFCLSSPLGITAGCALILCAWRYVVRYSRSIIGGLYPLIGDASANVVTIELGERT